MPDKKKGIPYNHSQKSDAPYKPYRTQFGKGKGSQKAKKK